MKSKLLLFALLLMGVSAVAQTVSVTISEDCSMNGVNTTTKLEMVDLGLSVKWANRNVGAAYPEEYGNYYAWGEVRTKSRYNWEYYKYCDDLSGNKMTKYCTSSSYGTVDNKTTLEPVDDAAYVNWGGNWRMPTIAEWNELRAKCAWTWTIQNGVYGYLVSANNGKSIFLPATGYRDNLDYIGAGLDGYYWSSTLMTFPPNQAYSVKFNYSSINVNSYGYRRSGRSIRPVCP